MSRRGWLFYCPDCRRGWMGRGPMTLHLYGSAHVATHEEAGDIMDYAIEWTRSEAPGEAG